mgnify:CR=1 FL=1
MKGTLEAATLMVVLVKISSYREAVLNCGEYFRRRFTLTFG